MTQIINRESFQKMKENLKQKILSGAVFIYPTDTIYGIGCDARNESSVQRIRTLKRRPDTPFSVIAPSKDWIVQNCNIEKTFEWLAKLPGKFTLILKMKGSPVAKNITKDTLGVRIPDHWFARFVEEIGIPIITTSVNKHGEPPMNSIESLDPDIGNNVDFIINDGPLSGRPSTLVDLSKNQVKIVER